MIPIQYDHGQSIHWSVDFVQGKSVEPVAHHPTCNDSPIKNLLATHVIVYFLLAWIIEVLDKQSLDNRGCTYL